MDRNNTIEVYDWKLMLYELQIDGVDWKTGGKMLPLQYLQILIHIHFH